MVTRTEPLSIIRQCELLDLPRSTFYHVPTPISEADLELMKLIDRCHMELPFYGSRRMVDWLGDEGHLVNRKRVQRLMRTMGIVRFTRRKI
jgi:putative transposase